MKLGEISKMRTYKLTISYDGSRYQGWQRQATTDNTIQFVLEWSIGKLVGYRVQVDGSGRTDAGVHAIAQVFHFDSELKMSKEQWRRAMNALLPADIRMQDVEKVREDFHARFDAISKRYDYYLSYDVDNPFLQRYRAFYRGRLNIERMKECAALFVGTHDFTSFTSSRIDSRKSRVRTITMCTIEETADGLHFRLEGNSFLRYMVRMIVGTLIEAGRDRLSVQEVKAMLEAKDKEACRYKAPGSGLYLVEVRYPEEEA